jgi:hypothetical protein
MPIVSSGLTAMFASMAPIITAQYFSLPVDQQ